MPTGVVDPRSPVQSRGSRTRCGETASHAGNSGVTVRAPRTAVPPKSWAAQQRCRRQPNIDAAGVVVLGGVCAQDRRSPLRSSAASPPARRSVRQTGGSGRRTTMDESTAPMIFQENVKHQARNWSARRAATPPGAGGHQHRSCAPPVVFCRALRPPAVGSPCNSALLKTFQQFPSPAMASG